MIARLREAGESDAPARSTLFAQRTEIFTHGRTAQHHGGDVRCVGADSIGGAPVSPAFLSHATMNGLPRPLEAAFTTCGRADQKVAKRPRRLCHKRIAEVPDETEAQAPRHRRVGPVVRRARIRKQRGNPVSSVAVPVDGLQQRQRQDIAAQRASGNPVQIQQRQRNCSLLRCMTCVFDNDSCIPPDPLHALRLRSRSRTIARPSGNRDADLRSPKRSSQTVEADTPFRPSRDRRRRNLVISSLGFSRSFRLGYARTKRAR